MKILLVSNYRPDKQLSMLGFARMLGEGLNKAGLAVSEIYPKAVFGNLGQSMSKTNKWFAYADKYLIFPGTLRRHLRKASPHIFHICDHSNSVYLPLLAKETNLVTCHDVIAIRSAQDHFPQARVGHLGQKLQKRILRSLQTANHITCDSENSRRDLVKLAPCVADKSNVVHLGFNQPMKRLSHAQAAILMTPLKMPSDSPFLLHVGNDAWYKNRFDLLRIFSCFRKRFVKPVKLVMVGPSLNEKQLNFADQEGFTNDIINISQVSEELLVALYSTALALIFPSLYEGFGWPPLEAQACGCPVVASPLGSLSEILQDGGILIDPENVEEYAESIHRLSEESSFREQEIKRGYSNASRFDAEKMVSRYISAYEHVVEHQSSPK